MALSPITAYYKLEDTSDASGNGNTLTNTGTVAFSTPGKILNGAQYVGSGTKRLSVANANGYDSSRGNTWNFWVFVPSFSGTGNQWYFDTETTAGTANTRVVVYNSSAAIITVQFGDFTKVVNSSSLSTSTWYMLTVVMGGTGANQCEFFVNTVSQGTVTMGSSGANRNMFSIGNAADSLGVEANASIDEFSAFPQTLTGADISYLYNAGSPGTAQQYPFSSGSVVQPNNLLTMGC